jgi:hypothetical protein
VPERWEARLERAVEAWNRGDVQESVTTLLTGVDPEIEVHPDPSWPEKGPFKGFEGSRDLVGSWLVAWGTAGTVEIDEFRDLGERMIVRARFNLAGAGSGAEVEMATSCVAELEDGIAVRCHFFFDHEEALRLAGLADS